MSETPRRPGPDSLSRENRNIRIPRLGFLGAFVGQVAEDFLLLIFTICIFSPSGFLASVAKADCHSSYSPCCLKDSTVGLSVQTMSSGDKHGPQWTLLS